MVGVHGIHPEFFSGFTDFIGKGAGLIFDALFLLGAVAITINTNPWSVFVTPTEDAVDEILEVVETVSALTDEDGLIGRVDIESVSVLAGDLDFVFEPEFSEHGFEDGLCLRRCF